MIISTVMIMNIDRVSGIGEPGMYRLRRRGIAARVGTVIVAIAAIAAMALPGAAAATAASSSPSASPAASASPTTCGTTTSCTKCVPKGMGTTCTGTYSGDNAYDPWLDKWDGLSGAVPNSPGGQISHPPVVTVSQTKNLNDQSVNVSWQYFTPTLSTSQAPNPTGNLKFYKVLIYECKGADPAVDSSGLGNSCAEEQVGQPDVTTQTGAPNAVTGITYALDASGGGPNSYNWGGDSSNSNTGGDPADWKGQAQIHIEVGGQENSKLGCGPGTPCSLVIVPNFGGNYDFDPSGAPSNTITADCENHSFDDPFDAFGADASNAADSFACEFRDRIVVPLSFSPTAVSSGCPGGNPQFNAEGSPMLQRAMTQWQSGFCKGSAPVNLGFTSLDESDAREQFLQGAQALSSSVDMALVTLPATGQTSSRKFTYAPLANSGVAMAYYLDDAADGRPVGQVVLDPRLAAKLTTESYSLTFGCTVPPPQDQPPGGKPWPGLPNPSETCDPAVKDNPNTIFDDPEFQALNTHCQPLFEAADYSCGASDFADDFFAGGDDKGGDFLPTVLGASNDMTFQLTDWTGADPDAAGFLAGKKDLWGMSVNTNYKNVSYPIEQFDTHKDPGTTPPWPITCTAGGCGIDATMQVAWNPDSTLGLISSNLLDLQPNTDSTDLLCVLAQCNPPFPMGDYGFKSNGPEAPGARALFSELDLGDVASYQFPAAAMVNGAGDAVAPTQASVEAAVKDMKTNPDGVTQFANESSTDPAAYPLAMVDYAMVPTCGLSSSKASAIANFLDKVATSGQTQGFTPGTLAPGYYPLTSAQRAQTLKAAQDVKSQDCHTLPPDNTVSGHRINDVSSPPSGSGTPGTPGNTSLGGGKAPNHTSVPGGSGKTPPAALKGLQPEAFGQKSADSGLTGILLLIAIIVGAILLVGGPAAWVVTATGKWPVVLRWLRPVLAQLTAARTWLTGLLPTGRA
jgi:ABC-type phosphate transport system substrate-binding protein